MSSLVEKFNEIDKSIRYTWETKIFSEVQKYSELTESQQIRLYIIICKAFEKKVNPTYFSTNPAIEMSDIIEDNPKLTKKQCSEIFIECWIEEIKKAHSGIYNYLKDSSTKWDKNKVSKTILRVDTNDSPFAIKSKYSQNDLSGTNPPITIKELLPYVKKTLNSVNDSISKREFEHPLQTLDINFILRQNALPVSKFNKQIQNDNAFKIINFVFSLYNIWDWTPTLLYNDKFNFSKIIEIIRITINKHINNSDVEKLAIYKEYKKIVNSMFQDLIDELKSREVEWNKEKQVVVNKNLKVKKGITRDV